MKTKLYIRRGLERMLWCWIQESNLRFNAVLKNAHCSNIFIF
jgi:hypothetical protein